MTDYPERKPPDDETAAVIAEGRELGILPPINNPSPGDAVPQDGSAVAGTGDGSPDKPTAAECAVALRSFGGTDQRERLYTAAAEHLEQYAQRQPGWIAELERERNVLQAEVERLLKLFEDVMCTYDNCAGDCAHCKTKREALGDE